MTLLNMKTNFLDLDSTGQIEFFEKYLTKRTKDLTEPLVSPRSKGKTRKGGKQIKLTNAQYELLQKLGLV